MIYVFGDSHALFNLKDIDISYQNLYSPSITMHRIGRDNIIINFLPQYNNSDNTFILFYGEVDCRCHIGKQIAAGRELNEIIETLVTKYFTTISNNITKYKQIIISSITPPVNQTKYESMHGPIMNDVAFVGTDNERSLYTKLMNETLYKYCQKYNYTFLDTYEYYSDSDGLLFFEKSDKVCHIIDNKYIHEKIKKIIIL